MSLNILKTDHALLYNTQHSTICNEYFAYVYTLLHFTCKIIFNPSLTSHCPLYNFIRSQVTHSFELCSDVSKRFLLPHTQTHTYT